MNTRALKANYTIDPKDINEVSKVMEEELGNAIREEIDWEIVSDLLVSLDGWIKVKLNLETLVSKNPEMFMEIQDWVIENVEGSFKSHGTEWLFRDEKDAALFALRWS